MSELLAIQQEAYSAYATGQVIDTRAACSTTSPASSHNLFKKGRTKTAPAG